MDDRISYTEGQWTGNECHEGEREQGGDVEESEAEDLNDFEEQEIRMVDEEADEYEEFFTWQAIVDSELQRQRSDDERRQEAIAIAGLIVYGLGEAERHRAERRRERRLYLVRGDLLKTAREGTPWQVLNSSKNDRAFITTMGFDVATFDLILSSGFEERWNSMPIPRADAPSTAAPRLSRRSLDARGALGLILHHLNSTMHDVSLCEIFALIPSTVTRYIQFSLQILLITLREMHITRVEWPQGDEFQEHNARICVRHPLLTGAFGSMDGLNLPAQQSREQEIENATFNGWLQGHFISSVFAFDSRGMLIHN